MNKTNSPQFSPNEQYGSPVHGVVPVRFQPQQSQPIQQRRPTVVSPGTTAALIASDPSLMANQNAPAPFLAPARGPATRGGRGGATLVTPGRALNAIPNDGAMQQKIAYHTGGPQYLRPPVSRIPNTQPKDPSINDVLAEEEALNAQFVQRQMANKRAPQAAEGPKQPEMLQTSYQQPGASSLPALDTVRSPTSDQKQRGRPMVSPIAAD